MTFAPLTLAVAKSARRVRLAKDALDARQRVPFRGLGRPAGADVVVERAARRDASLYVSRALAVGDAPRFDTG